MIYGSIHRLENKCGSKSKAIEWFMTPVAGILIWSLFVHLCGAGGLALTPEYKRCIESVKAHYFTAMGEKLGATFRDEPRGIWAFAGDKPPSVNFFTTEATAKGFTKFSHFQKVRLEFARSYGTDCDIVFNRVRSFKPDFAKFATPRETTVSVRLERTLLNTSDEVGAIEIVSDYSNAVIPPSQRRLGKNVFWGSFTIWHLAKGRNLKKFDGTALDSMNWTLTEVQFRFDLDYPQTSAEADRRVEKALAGIVDFANDTIAMSRRAMAGADLLDRSRIKDLSAETGKTAAGGSGLSDIGKNLGLSAAKKAADSLAPDDTGLSIDQVTSRIEGLIIGKRGPAVTEALEAEEKAASEAGDGGGLKILDTITPRVPATPGEKVSIGVKVKNNATAGNPAVFDIYVTDYHDNNKIVDRIRSQRLGPGDTRTFSLTVTAPRDYSFGGWACLDPVNFSGGEMPIMAANFKVQWDGATMSDGEIEALLKEKNPVQEYAITPGAMASWIEEYRGDAQGTIFKLQQAAFDWQRERMEQERMRALTDPARLESLAADLEAKENTRRLAEYFNLHKWAVREGGRNSLPLSSIMEEQVFVDENARVHGDLPRARELMNEAIREKNSRSNALESFLIDYGEPDGSKTYRAMEPVMTPNTAAVTIIDKGIIENTFGEGFFDAVDKGYRELTRDLKNPDTSPKAIEKSIESLEKTIGQVKSRISRLEGIHGSGRISLIMKKYQDYLSKISKEADNFRGIMKKVDGYRKKVAGLFEERKMAQRVSKTLNRLVDVWNWYEVMEKTSARVEQGEPLYSAFAREAALLQSKGFFLGSRVWGLKKSPVVAVADAIYTVGGHVVYAGGRMLKGKKYWEDRGIDPRQYNASSMIDMGVGATLAMSEEIGAGLGKIWDRKHRLTSGERADMEERLKVLEDKLNSTTDKALSEKLVKSRTMLMQLLRENR